MPRRPTNCSGWNRGAWWLERASGPAPASARTKEARESVDSRARSGSAYGIRTRDLRLERAVSWAARRTRHAPTESGTNGTPSVPSGSIRRRLFRRSGRGWNRALCPFAAPMGSNAAELQRYRGVPFFARRLFAGPPAVETTGYSDKTASRFAKPSDRGHGRHVTGMRISEPRRRRSTTCSGAGERPAVSTGP